MTDINEIDPFFHELIKNFKPFKPCASYYQGLNFLLYLEEDCSYVSQHIPGSNIELLWHSQDQTKLVGVQIWGYAQVSPPEVIEAYLRKYDAEDNGGVAESGLRHSS